MYVPSLYHFHHTQIPDRGEELNYYFIEDNVYIPTYSVLMYDGIRNLENFSYYYDFDFTEGRLRVAPNTVRNIKQYLYNNGSIC